MTIRLDRRSRLLNNGCGGADAIMTATHVAEKMVALRVFAMEPQ